MTANRLQVGVLAVGLLVVLVAIGCSASDLISSGNLVVTYPATTSNPSSITYQCIRMDYTTMKVRPVDGVCSAASAPGLEGEPCGVDVDCCLTPQDCPSGVCEGGLASDTLGGNPILLIANAAQIVAYFTPTCPTCTLNLNRPVLCDPVAAAECTNPCLPAGEVEAVCLTPKCCENSVLVSAPCETDADCPVNECADSATTIPSSVLPEGKYEVTEFALNRLLMSSPNGPRPLTSCAGQNVADQYDPPLRFNIGAGLTNQIHFDMDLTQLESLLGPQPAALCNVAFGSTPTWFHLVTD